MRKPVLLKVPGLYMCRIAALTKFIDSVENRIEESSETVSRRKSSEYMRYVDLLGIEKDSKEEALTPTYRVSVTILAEFALEDNIVRTTDRDLVNKVFHLLGVFPKTL